MTSIRVLGVDPGTQNTGWGIVDLNGARLSAVAAGVIRMPQKAPLEQRLSQIYDDLRVTMDRHRPTAFAIEDIFYAEFANAAMKLGHARGVALLAAAHNNLTAHSYAPSLVKRTVTGRGRASKDQVAQLVGSLLSLKSLPPVDATDALAIAITHAQVVRTQMRTLQR